LSSSPLRERQGMLNCLAGVDRAHRAGRRRAC
jgi:hypothetical protein